MREVNRQIHLGFQEVLLRQLNDLDALLGDEWARVGVGRDDGAVRGEFSPIFYKKQVKLSVLSLMLIRGPF